MLLVGAGKAKSIVPSGTQSMPKATIIRPAGTTKKSQLLSRGFLFFGLRIRSTFSVTHNPAFPAFGGPQLF